MKNYEYKVERISGDLEQYLNEKAKLGWRCVSVTQATGLGWTQIVVLEKLINENTAESGDN